MGNDHSHVSAGMRNRKNLLIALGLGCSVLVVQLTGALLSGSLALLADSVHVFADVLGVGLAAAAVTVAARPTKAHRTFGLYRLEVLATVFNGLLLLGLSGYILIEAWRRWFEPTDISAPIMIVSAGYGLAANVASLLILRKGSAESMNVRSAYLEVMSDAMGSFGVIVAGIVVMITGWERADVIVSVAIALFIIPRTLTLLRQAFSVLMENAPRGLSLEEVRTHMLDVDAVVEVHDLHAWTITSGMPALSAHVIVEPDPFEGGTGGRVLDQLAECLHEHFEIEHTTFQLEPWQHKDHEDPRHP